MSGESCQMVKSKRRWVQFSLMSLFVVITVLSVGPLWWLRTQMEGELQTEGLILLPLGGSRETLFFSCAKASDTNSLANSFDREAFLESVMQRLEGTAMTTPIAFYHGTDENVLFVGYDFDQWGRRHLELPSCRYVFDVNDPAAQERNVAIHQAVIDAGRSYAADHSSVVKFEHLPGMGIGRIVR